MRWFNQIKNADITRRTGLPYIGDLIQKRRHALFANVARMDSQAPAHVALKLCRDNTMGRRVPLRKGLGSIAYYMVRSVKGQGETNIDTLDPGSRQIAVEEGRNGVAGLRDLVVVIVLLKCYY